MGDARMPGPVRWVARQRSRLLDAVLAASAFVVDGLSWQGSGDELAVRFEGPTMLLTAAASVALLFRRRWPVPVFCAWIAVGLTPLLVTGHQPFVGLFASLYTVARLRGSVVATAALLAAFVPLGINAYHTAEGSEQPLALGLASLIWLLAGTAFWTVGRVGHATQRRARQREEDLVKEKAEALQSERLALARELHDIVGHAVSAMIMQAAGARAVSRHEEPAVDAALRVIESAGAEAMRDLHQLLQVLRAVDDQDGPTIGTGHDDAGDLDGLLDSARRAGLDVTLDVAGRPGDVEPIVTHSVYRIVQESLANAMKHGGPRSRVAVRCAWEPESVTVEVRNTLVVGAGAGAELSGGFGLQGLLERVDLLGGTFRSGPQDDGSYVTVAELPCRVGGATFAGDAERA